MLGALSLTPRCLWLHNLSAGVEEVQRCKDRCRARVSEGSFVAQVTALRADVERLTKDYETTRVERDKVGTPP